MRRIAFGIIVCALLLPTGGVAQDYDAGLKAARSGEYADALKEWRPLAAKGHAQAQHQLGLMYLHGRGVKRDYGQAAKWYGKAAGQGLAASQLALGRLYVAGRGIEKDFPKALSLFRKAAAQGSAAAKNNLAYMYRYGKGVSPDIGKAMILYLDSASQGYAPALDNLGMLFANGRSVPKDYVEAYKWLTLAKEFGSARGARYLKYVTKKMTSGQVAKAETLSRDWIADFRKRKKQ
jgi:TPR repeat protein